jgi:riboflavin synthase
MFTGLIQETGEITDLRRMKARNGDVLTRITVSAKAIPKELKLGDSVAVSGVCLTAVAIGRRNFSADLADETLKRTSLSGLKKKSLVNLELPARPQDRLGGHIVQGHVDGTGKLASLTKIKGQDDWRLVIDMPLELAKYVAAQGSITVEGISLTVAAIEGHRVEVAIIPHTYEQTNLRDLRAGSAVNLEVDVLAKYVEKLTQKASAPALDIAGLVKRGF